MHIVPLTHHLACIHAAAYDWDNYSRPMTHYEYQPVDWRNVYLGHPCYSPDKVRTTNSCNSCMEVRSVLPSPLCRPAWGPQHASTKT